MRHCTGVNFVKKVKEDFTLRSSRDGIQTVNVTVLRMMASNMYLDILVGQAHFKLVRLIYMY